MIRTPADAPVVFKEKNGKILIARVFGFEVEAMKHNGWKSGQVETMTKVEGGYNIFVRSDD